VPDDPGQVVYVWWDALCNYITALGYGTGSPAYQEWWCRSDARVHVVGKGITRFHAVYWLALLISTGQPLPTAVYVHDYLTVAGAKISKSSGRAESPDGLLNRYGTDALRWWLVSDVARVGDTDFTEERLLRRYHQDLAGGVGNLVHRTCRMVQQFGGGRVRPDAADRGGTLAELARVLPGAIDADLDRFDLRAACSRVTGLVAAANRYIDDERPWELAGREADPALAQGHLEVVLATLVQACRVLVTELAPFIPEGAAQLAAQLGRDAEVIGGNPVFPRLDQQ
jgi:methionyl-tRNA synthetase